MKRTIHDIEQNTDEWFQLRMGKVTASNFSTVMANFGKAFGKPALDYAMRIAIESVTRIAIETYHNDWMERGKVLEQEAREQYEAKMFTEVHPGGMATSGRYGASADGQTEDNGVVEIKCVKYSTHFQRLVHGDIDLAYKWQVRGQMWLYDVDYCDFISYCPEMPYDKRLYTCRVMRDKSLEGDLQARLDDLLLKVDMYTKILES